MCGQFLQKVAIIQTIMLGMQKRGILNGFNTTVTFTFVIQLNKYRDI